jgi:hypothetical protein
MDTAAAPKGARPIPPDIRHIEIEGVLTSVPREPLESDDFYETRCVCAGVAHAAAARESRRAGPGGARGEGRGGVARDDVLKRAYEAKIGVTY